jgi:predicted Rossmann-fold nucleotide-binding protein
MEAACRGAAEANGASLGLTLAVFGDRGANPFVTREIKNATLFERLSNFVELSDSFVVLGGGLGTLAELFTIWNLKQTAALDARPFILLGPNWPAIIQYLRANTEIREKDLMLIHILEKPEQVIEFLNKRLKQ